MQLLGCNNIKYLKLFEVQCNVLFLSVFGVELAVKYERKRVKNVECGRIHILSLKLQNMSLVYYY